MSARIDLTNLIRSMQQARADVRAEAAKAVETYAWLTLAKAQTYTPIRTSALQGSGTVAPPTFAGANVSVFLGFNVPYAAAVHENVGANFNLGTNPLARAKFLELAIRETAPGFVPFVAERLRPLMERGSR